MPSKPLLGPCLYRALAIGASAGGREALIALFRALAPAFPIPILVVRHLAAHADTSMVDDLRENTPLHIKEAEENETPLPGIAYFAPANYHLLVEQNGALALSVDPPVNHARPSVDTLFESASDAYGPRLIGLVLTGAGCDGARGLARIKARGGVTIAEDPDSAAVSGMPTSALRQCPVDYRLHLPEIAPVLQRLTQPTITLSNPLTHVVIQ